MPFTDTQAAHDNLDRLHTSLRFAMMDVESLRNGVANDPDLAMNFISAMMPPLNDLLKSAKHYAEQSLHAARVNSEAERQAYHAAHAGDPNFVAEAAE